MKFCAACSMPVEDNNLIGLSANGNDFCIYCVDDNKEVKSCEDVFNGGVQYFVNDLRLSAEEAEKLTRKTMSMLPYWQDNTAECLKGEMLSDDDYQKFFKNY